MIRDIDAALFIAAERGDPAAIQAALDQGAWPKAKDYEGNTALILAAGSSLSEDCLRLLLPISDPNALNTAGESALMRAAAAGFVAGARLLMPASDQTLRGPLGQSALRCAVDSGSAPCVELLAAGAGPRPKGDQTATPLMAAAQAGRADMIQALLPFENPLEIDSIGRTALMWAVGGTAPFAAKIRAIDLLLKSSEASAMDLDGLDAVDWGRRAGLPAEVIEAMALQAHSERERVSLALETAAPAARAAGARI